MRSVVPVLCAALLLGGVSGCAAGDVSALPATAVAEIEAFETALEGLDGVDDAVLTTSQSGSQVHLVVELDDEVTPEQAAAAALEANTLRTAPLPAGVYPGFIELHLGDSVYAHFSAPTDEALAAQAAFWLQLARTGAEAVSLRTFTQPVQPPVDASPIPSSTGAAPLLLNSPTGRYIGVTMPADGDDAAEVIEAIRAVPDPGASLGEWHFVSEDARVRAEFAGATLPPGGDMSLATELLSTLDDIEHGAMLSVRLAGDGGQRSISAEMTAFDERLEGVDAGAVQERLLETAIWPAALVLIETLDRTGEDFDVSLLSNPLADAGSFLFSVSVADCAFSGDDEWPLLSVAAAEALDAARDARRAGTCAAD